MFGGGFEGCGSAFDGGGAFDAGGRCKDEADGCCGSNEKGSKLPASCVALMMCISSRISLASSEPDRTAGPQR